MNTDETILDSEEAISGFCRLGCKVGEYLSAQRDCFCPVPNNAVGRPGEGFDLAIIEWIEEAVDERLERDFPDGLPSSPFVTREYGQRLDVTKLTSALKKGGPGEEA